ncbi:MAG: hypothetical protein M1826_004358 [Phylliscum demangeonii]|nr:MAG: hypothetical protein M1826_004358 [Phylliscum demangeonii]
MVSLWPWRGDTSSPEAFERALSLLSGKIARTSAQHDRLRQRARRLQALWTLYAVFGYMLTSVILALVVGWRQWGAAEYSAVAGGPLLWVPPSSRMRSFFFFVGLTDGKPNKSIYVVRRALRSYYDYRLSFVAARLEELQDERDATIEKLKASTKYNSTQQLLEKYGGGGGASSSVPPAATTPGAGPGSKHRPSPQPPLRDQIATTTPTPYRTPPQRPTVIPPPTANIPRGSPLGAAPPGSPPAALATPRTHAAVGFPPPGSDGGDAVEPGPAEFAPNAFTSPPAVRPSPATAAAPPPPLRAPPSAPSSTAAPSHWYDRVLDVLLGEDETLARNRLALLCAQCKLVNGQAAPGLKTLEDVGRWRCAGCGAWNGEEDEARMWVDRMKMVGRAGREEEDEENEDEDEEDEDADEDEDEDEEQQQRHRRQRQRPRERERQRERQRQPQPQPHDDDEEEEEEEADDSNDAEEEDDDDREDFGRRRDTGKASGAGNANANTNAKAKANSEDDDDDDDNDDGGGRGSPPSVVQQPPRRSTRGGRAAKGAQAPAPRNEAERSSSR